MSRIEMPINCYSLHQQIINHMVNVDFKKFLEENQAANTYFEGLNKDQQEQYIEDFWYFVQLVGNVAKPLTNIEFPEHKK